MRIVCLSIVGLLGLSLTVLAADAATQVTTAKTEEGWEILFDGKSADNFRNYGKTDLNPLWKIADGTLTLTGKGGGDIVTKKQYDAFELTLDYKISKGGNSGLMYHVKETDKPPYFTGPEVQIQDNVDGKDPQKAGWLYQLYPAMTDATKPAGEWNTLRILITPEKCEHYMNGVKYCEYDKGSKDWDEKVAKSKFAKWEGKDKETKEMVAFGKPTKGYICLQDHGNEVSYRNIKIRPIASK